MKLENIAFVIVFLSIVSVSIFTPLAVDDKDLFVKRTKDDFSLGPGESLTIFDTTHEVYFKPVIITGDLLNVTYTVTVDHPPYQFPVVNFVNADNDSILFDLNGSPLLIIENSGESVITGYYELHFKLMRNYYP